MRANQDGLPCSGSASAGTNITPHTVNDRTITSEPGRVAHYVLRAVIVFSAAVLALELGVRFLVMGPGILFAPDADIGKVPTKGTHVLWGTEGFGRTNYVRNGEISTPFAGGPVVPVLGDSHTEAYHVNDSAKFVSIAETLLRQKGRVADFRNLGFSGGTLADYVQLGPSIIARHHPAKVVIQLTAADFGPESFDTTRVNYFVRESSGSLALRHRNAPVGPPTMGARIKHYSALVNYLQMRYLTIAEWRAEHSTVKNTTNNISGAEVTQDTIVAKMDLLRRSYETTPVIPLILPRIPRIQSRAVITVNQAHEQFVKIGLITSTLPTLRRTRRYARLLPDGGCGG